MRAFLTVREAADELGVSERTLRRIIADGELPTVSFRRRRYIPRRAIDAIIDRAMEGFDPDRVAETQRPPAP